MKASRLLTYAGAALLLVALALLIRCGAPTISSRLYTRSIPTAPLLAPLLADSAPGSRPDVGEVALLPFEGAGSFPTKALAITVTPTPAAPSPTEVVNADPPTPMLSETTNATATLTPSIGAVPSYLHIPILELDAPVVPIGLKTVTVKGTAARMWDVPAYRAAGWHDTSAHLGLPGNTVLNGHNTSSGEVFRDLYKVPLGALVVVRSQDGEEFAYRVKEKYILLEAGQSLEVRLENALYVQETSDERLTLVTCHPYGSLVNRLIIIALPAPPMSQRGE